MADYPILKVIIKAIDRITPRKGLNHVLNTRLYSNALYLMLNTVSMSFFGFLFWMVAARFYTEAEVGFSSAIISSIGLLCNLSLLGLNATLIRFMHQTENPKDLINTCFTLAGLVSLAFAAIFIAGLNLWSPALSFISKNAIFTSAFIAFTLSWRLFRIMDSTFIAKRRAEFTLFKNAIFSLLKIPLPIYFGLFFHSFGIVASWGVASGVAFILSLFLFLPKVQSAYKLVPSLNLTLLKPMWRYSGSSYLANLMTGTPLFLLPIMVVNLLGAESNAYFYIAWMMAGLLFTIPTAVSSSLFAEGSHFEDELNENIVRSFKFTFLLLVPIVALFIFASKWLLLLFGDSYSINALRLLQILAISSLPLAINRIYSAILRVTNRMIELMIIGGFVATVVLVASYLSIPLIGITGIGYSWLGTQFALAIYVSTRRQFWKTLVGNPPQH